LLEPRGRPLSAVPGRSAGYRPDPAFRENDGAHGHCGHGGVDGYEYAIYWYYKAIYALGTLLAVPLIAYGILRAHLFDIDLKIRWTIKQSTLAALVVAIIFLVSEGASTFLSVELGTVAGLIGAAVVIFFLTPLQHFAERVAATAMPRTQNTPEYVAFRKMQVYEAALIDAMSEGRH